MKNVFLLMHIQKGQPRQTEYEQASIVISILRIKKLKSVIAELSSCTTSENT